MKNISNGYLLMIEPSAAVSAEPVIDALTLRMAAALIRARAQHEAACSPGSADSCLISTARYAQGE